MDIVCAPEGADIVREADIVQPRRGWISFPMSLTPVCPAMYGKKSPFLCCRNGRYQHAPDITTAVHQVRYNLRFSQAGFL